MRTNTTKAKLMAGEVVFGGISALGLLRVGAEGFRKQVEGAVKEWPSRASGNDQGMAFDGLRQRLIKGP